MTERQSTRLRTSGPSSCVPCLLPPGAITRSREIPSDSIGEDPEEQIVGAARCGAWSCKGCHVRFQTTQLHTQWMERNTRSHCGPSAWGIAVSKNMA